jgi:hypothetical protein
MFSLSALLPKHQPKWKVATKAGVMFRECARTGRLQYRDCATGRWIDVESHNALAWMIRDSQELLPQTPAWIQNRTAGPEEA